MSYHNVAPSRLPTFLLPCPFCGHRMAVTSVTPTMFAAEVAAEGCMKQSKNLELSVRLATASYQPVDTIADCDERKSRANDRSRSAMDATTCPIGGG